MARIPNSECVLHLCQLQIEKPKSWQFLSYEAETLHADSVTAFNEAIRAQLAHCVLLYSCGPTNDLVENSITKQ